LCKTELKQSKGADVYTLALFFILGSYFNTINFAIQKMEATNNGKIHH